MSGRRAARASGGADDGGWTGAARRGQRLLAIAVEPPAGQRLPPGARGDHLVERAVERRAQLGVGGAQRDRVAPLGDVGHGGQRRMAADVAGDDDVVEQHGVRPTVLEIHELLVDPLVGDRDGARLAQQVPGLRVGQRSDAQVAQRAQVAHPIVAAAGDQPLAEDVVRAGEADAGGARRRHLDAVEGDVEGAPLERRDQRRPVVLDHARADPERARQGIRQVDLEAAERAAARGILEGVGLAPLFVGAPEQLPARRDPCQSSAVRPVFGRGTARRRPDQHRSAREGERGHLSRFRFS